MKNPLNEGQTQVYMNSQIVPQVGIDLNAPYLNQVPSQLMDLVVTLFNSGSKTGLVKGKVVNMGAKTDAQVLAVLVGMGTPQQLALAAIQKYRQLTGPSITTENINQKNQHKMKFTLANLYEAVTNSLQELKQINSDNSRISYSTTDSIKILENQLQHFPLRFRNNSSEVISEDVENAVNPTLKFKIARDLYNGLSTHSWIQPVKNLRSYIQTVFESNKLLFRISEAVERVSVQKSTLNEKLSNELTQILSESNSDIYGKFEAVAKRNPWSNDCKAIMNELKIQESQLVNTKEGKIVKIYSPILENENGIFFHLHGKDYALVEGELKETFVADSRFRNVLEGLKLFKQEGDSFLTFGQNNKVLEYNVTNGKLTLGEYDLTNVSEIELKEALMTTNFFGYRDQWKVDVTCRLFESIDMICEMDNFTSIQSQEFLALYLTMINIEESIFINKVNGSMKLNEMIKVNTATEAVKLVKEFINYDITPILSERLVKENNQKAIQEKKTRELNDLISFLESKRVEIKTAISTYGESTELKEALNIIQSEINQKERELANSYISEKDEKKKVKGQSQKAV
jgi:hypothetical protein